MKEVFFLVDATTRRMLYINSAYEQLTGRSRDDFLGSTISQFEAVHPWDLPAFREWEGKCLEKELEAEFRLNRADGQTRWVRVQSFPVPNPKGEIVRIAGIIEDVTERKLAAEQIQQQDNRLGALRAIDGAITASLDLQVVLHVVLEQVTSQLGVDASDILLLNPHSMTLEFTLEGWAPALKLRDIETYDHTLRVTEITIKVSRTKGVADKELVHVRRGAILHDIGKLGIPDAILHKPGPLSPEEWEVMRRHPEYARNLLHPVAYLRPAIKIPYCHHEKFDGTGYPQGLAGNAIPLEARIFAVADVLDALESDHPYRKAWPREKVHTHILEQSGTHFCPEVIACFQRLGILQTLIISVFYKFTSLRPGRAEREKGLHSVNIFTFTEPLYLPR